MMGCSKNELLGIWMSGNCPVMKSWPLVPSRILGDDSEDKEDICEGLRRPICSRSVGMVLMLLELGLVAMAAAD
jgi:hypothetical protein